MYVRVGPNRCTVHNAMYMYARLSGDNQGFLLYYMYVPTIPRAWPDRNFESLGMLRVSTNFWSIFMHFMHLMIEMD